MTIDMTYWCESCARKNYCYTIRSRPKCFTPITNTAHGTPESYLAKALRFSRDSHEIAKTEPNCSEKPNNCEDEDIFEYCPRCGMRMLSKWYEPKDEPKTQMETQNSNLTFEKRTMRDCYNCKRYETEGECIECHYEPKDEPQTERSSE